MRSLKIGWTGLLMVAQFLFLACKDDNELRGDKLFEQGKFEEAIVAYDDYLTLNPTHLKSIYNKGRAFEELGQYAKSLEVFKTALKVDGKNVATWLSIGQYYYRAEDYENAAYHFEEATELDNANATAFFLLGRSLHLQGKVVEAMEAYDDAISLNDELGDAYLYRGAVKAHLGRNASACNDFKTARTLQVKDAEEAISKYCE